LLNVMVEFTKGAGAAYTKREKTKRTTWRGRTPMTPQAKGGRHGFSREKTGPKVLDQETGS